MQIAKLYQSYAIDDVTGETAYSGLKTAVVADQPLDLSAIKIDTITMGEWINIPYSCPALRKQCEPLMYEIAQQNDWVFPDLERSKISIIINPEKDIFSPDLLIEVDPPQYTEPEKAAILGQVSKEPIFADADISEYDNWCDIFDAAASYHHSGASYDRSIAGVYKINMTPAEQAAIQWIVIQWLIASN